MYRRYKAIYMPDDEGRQNWTTSGFKSRKEAENYILSRISDSCRVNFDDHLQSSSMAEWRIEEYDEWYLKEYKE